MTRELRRKYENVIKYVLLFCHSERSEESPTCQGYLSSQGILRRSKPWNGWPPCAAMFPTRASKRTSPYWPVATKA